MWYRLKSIFLNLYLKWGIVLCEYTLFHYSLFSGCDYRSSTVFQQANIDRRKIVVHSGIEPSFVQTDFRSKSLRSQNEANSAKSSNEI